MKKNNRPQSVSPFARKAFAMLEAARPKSGDMPETPEEWNKLLAANEELGYAMYRDQGMNEEEARRVAKMIHGGPSGMLLLKMSMELAE